MRVIKSFNIDTSELNSNKEKRNFHIIGDNSAVFTLEVKNSDGQYYNFSTQSFSSAKKRLTRKIVGDSFKGSIVFPAATNKTYDLYLWAENRYKTKHAPYKEVRFGDGSIDVNSSTGSNSDLLQKKLYQYQNSVITLTASSPNSLTPWGSVSITTDSITGQRGQRVFNKDFTITVLAASTRSIAINRQPSENDFYYTENRVIGDPSQITGENIWAGTARSTNRVVNGDFSSGATNITMDDDVGSYWAVGDRVTGNATLDAKTGDNAVTVTAINVGSNAKVFTLSESIAINDDETLTFTPPHYHRWAIKSTSSLHNLKEDMFVTGTNIKSSSFLAPYSSYIEYNVDETQDVVESEVDRLEDIYDDRDLAEDVSRERTSDQDVEAVSTLAKVVELQAVDTLSFQPTITDGVVSKQLGNIIFNNQQSGDLADDTVAFWAYGPSSINRLTGGTVVELSNLKVELTDVTTTVSDSDANGSDALSTFTLASAAGIMDDVSFMSGVNITASGGRPRVTNISTNTITVTPGSHVLQNGQALTFKGSSRTATITGNIKISNLKANTVSLGFDLESFLTAV